METIKSLIYSLFESYERIALVLFGIIVFAVFFVFRNKLSKLVISIIGRICFNKEDKNQKRDSLRESMQKPLSTYLAVLGAFLGIYMNFQANSVIKAFKIATILIISWAIVNYLSNNLFLLFHFGEDADNKMNTTAIKFISNILKILVIAFAIVMAISELGYNVNGLLTGLGVGGLAVSLAAQDAVSNLISGFIIVFEKPFIVGEMIQTSTLLGTVEEVTMRSTKVRTLEDSIVTVPNSKLTDDAIYNISRMDKRLISLDFGVLYSTSNELLKKCQNDIKQYLIDDENVLPTPLRVNLSKLDDSALNINVTCYTVKTNVNEYLEVFNDINFKIKEIIETNGAEFAFPSTSVYIEKTNK